MARFFFSAVGAGGHVNPLLPIAAELVRRGHTVGFGTSRHLERKVAPNVTHFFRLGVDLSEESTEKPREWAKFNDLRGSRRLTFALRNVLFPLGERTAGEILEIRLRLHDLRGEHRGGNHRPAMGDHHTGAGGASE